MYKNNKQGFSLVELIVVIAIIGVLVILASPRFLGRTKEATLAKHLYNVKTLEDTMDRYVLENDRFPRLSEEAYTSEEVTAYANRIRDLTGEEISLDPEGKYYDIDYVTLKDYVKVPDKKDMPNYILQNPVGKVFFLEELTEVANDRADFTISNPSNEAPAIKVENMFTENEEQSLLDKGFTEDDISMFKDEKYEKISTLEDLNNVKNNLEGKFIQVNDIDLSSIENFEPIGSSNKVVFRGVYNGGNFEIKDLSIEAPNDENVGLFGYSRGIIGNVKLVNVKVSGRKNVGGLVGASYTKITNSSSSGAVKGIENTGGLVGDASGHTSYINDSYSTANVSGVKNTGGLVGNDYYVNIRRSYTSGDVTGIENTGGIVGRANNQGNITAVYSTGNIVGETNTGGIAGYCYSSVINDSYSSGRIIGKEDYTGGIVGRAQVWGVKNSYSSGRVSGKKYTGGIVGHVDRKSIVNSYYYNSPTGHTITQEGTKITANEMKIQASYDKWDFDNMWEINRGEFPTLRWQNDN